MALELCTDCGRMHWATDECPAKRSTAARMDVPVIKGQTHSARGGHERTAPEPGTKGAETLSDANPGVANQVELRGTKSEAQTVGAGTQALPVDTTSRVSEPPKAYSNSKPKFDKTAYMAIYMRAWRQRQKLHLPNTPLESNADE